MNQKNDVIPTVQDMFRMLVLTCSLLILSLCMQLLLAQSLKSGPFPFPPHTLSPSHPFPLTPFPPHTLPPHTTSFSPHTLPSSHPSLLTPFPLTLFHPSHTHTPSQVNNACSTGSTALILAKQLVEGRMADCVLALRFENEASAIIER